MSIDKSRLRSDILITADSYTNLFIGVFMGTILFTLLQIEKYLAVNPWPYLVRLAVVTVYLCI
jgi:uncharacterized membrane protein